MKAIESFLLGFPALFSIVNPLVGAFFYREVTSDLSHSTRVRLASQVAVYSALVMLVSLWLGAYVLNFFGISLAAMRIAGGTLLALRAYQLLDAPETQEARKSAQAGTPIEEDANTAGLAFFPLTMPLTTGPGTMSVAIALGSSRPASGDGLLEYFTGVSLAALVVAVMVWISYRSADRLAELLNASARQTISRISAFLMMCIGVQITLIGLEDEVRRFMAG